MKKYELIKQYPSVFKVGNIVEEIPNGFFQREDGFCIHKSYLEKFPEFWKEVEDKKPILKTEDGVDIYFGDYTCLVNIVSWTVDYFTPKQCAPVSSSYKSFSSVASAEKYVKENKPQYSLNDLKDLVDFKHWQHPVYTDEEVVNNFIKQREKNG